MQPCAAAARAIAQSTMPDRTWAIVDNHTGATVGHPYTVASRARARRDKLDNAYGACRYSVRPVEKK